MASEELNLDELERLREAAGIGVELPITAHPSSSPNGSYRLVNGRQVVLCLGLSGLEADYLAALVNAAPELISGCRQRDALEHNVARQAGYMLRSDEGLTATRAEVERLRALVVRLDSLLSLLWYRPSAERDSTLTRDVMEAIGLARDAARAPAQREGAQA